MPVSEKQLHWRYISTIISCNILMFSQQFLEVFLLIETFLNNSYLNLRIFRWLKNKRCFCFGSFDTDIMDQCQLQESTKKLNRYKTTVVQSVNYSVLVHCLSKHQNFLKQIGSLAVSYNHSHNILELYNILVQIRFTTSKRKLDI